MTLWGVVGLSLMILFASGIDMNSVHAMLLAVTLTSLLMLFGRWEIFPLIIPTAVILSFLVWLLYVVFFIPIYPGVIQALWNLEATWGIMLVGVPIEEVLWGFTTGLFAGSAFRVCSTRPSGK